METKKYLDKKVFADGIAVLKGFYVGWQLDTKSKETMRIWYRSFMLMNEHDYQSIIKYYTDIRDFPPRSPKELLSVMTEMFAKNMPDANSAFVRMITWFNRFSYWSASSDKKRAMEEWLKKNHPLIHKCYMENYLEINDFSNKELGRLKFINAYEKNKAEFAQEDTKKVAEGKFTAKALIEQNKAKTMALASTEPKAIEKPKEDKKPLPNYHTVDVIMGSFKMKSTDDAMKEAEMERKRRQEEFEKKNLAEIERLMKERNQ